MPKINRNAPAAVAQQPAAPKKSTAAQSQAPVANRGWVKATNAAGIGGAAVDGAAAKKAFWHSPYTNADATAAKKAFGLKNLDEAKELIGRAVITRNERPLEDAGISRGRFDSHDCQVAFARSPYTDSDAKQALKNMPFLKNLSEAKQYIGLKVVNKTENILREVGVTRFQVDSHEQLDAFKRSGYSAADVEKAKKSFDFLKGASTKEVKEYMGLKVLNNYTEMLSAKGITPSRDRHETP